MKKITLPFLLLLLCSSIKAQLPEPKNILFFLYDGIEILDFTGPMEVLSAAGYNIYTVADKDTIVSRRILKIIPDYNFTKTSDFPKPDIVAVFGGMAHMVYENEHYKEFLRNVTSQSYLDFSVCDGAFFLGSIGLLDGKTSTTFHWLISELQKDFPKTTAIPDVKYVDNGRLITSAGVSAGIDAAFYLVSKLKGEAFALQVAELIEYDHWKPGTGKIIEDETTQAIKQQGCQAFAKANNNIPLFKGEISNLGKYFLEQQQYVEAEACFRLVLNNYKPNSLDYSNLSLTLKGQNKPAPPTKKEFLQKIYEDIIVANVVYQDIKTEFPDWQLLDRDDLLYIGYYDFQNHQKYDVALAIYQLNYNMFPDYHECRSYIAEVQLLKGEKQNAIQTYKDTLPLIKNEGTLQWIKNRISELEKMN
ncbi:MAG: DJ-1/PfpI family protein [Saprospiraceae bacterium]|nr:DJ-1/PfpI family protein [Saprospiraceae bacterium]